MPSGDLAGSRSMDDLDGRWLGQGNVAEGFGIDAIEEQAGASHTAGLDERSPIHRVGSGKRKGTAQATPWPMRFQEFRGPVLNLFVFHGFSLRTLWLKIGATRLKVQ